MTSATRCAVYTRKSTEEGLEQEFNTLHAQREACEAYVLSQAGEGWSLNAKLYDDGGYSGGNLDRPALKELLEDIDRGLVDVVVVYKIDRLTRSLADFAKLVERFDARNVSFVSVTQAFSTTTSMGRLTLNVLLSFAQFERELTAERIRDKFAASRRKGIFMGGCPPLGYDARDRKLLVNEEEAERVRHIFRRYLELGSIAKLRQDLEERGVPTKSWVSVRGRKMGGGRWYVGPLRHILRNRVYIGDVVYKGEVYNGQHEAILPKELFEAVQKRLDQSRVDHKRRTTIGSPHLLNGLIFDGLGYTMTPKISRREKGRIHSYYVSQAKLQRFEQPEDIVRPVANHIIEPLVLAHLHSIKRALGIHPESGAEESSVETRVEVRRYLSRVEIHHEKTCLVFSLDAFASEASLQPLEILGRVQSIGEVGERFDIDDEQLRLVIEGALPRRAGKKSVAGWNRSDARSPKLRHDPNLIKALVKANVWKDMIERGEVKSVLELAASINMEAKHCRATLHLAFLAPDIQRAILAGRQPNEFRLTALLEARIPDRWTDQRERLHFY